MRTVISDEKSEILIQNWIFLSVDTVSENGAKQRENQMKFVHKA